MGIFVYECSCGAREEAVFTSWRKRPDTLPCDCGCEKRYVIAPSVNDNHPIRGLLEDCSWLPEHAAVVSQEHYEGMKGNRRYRESVMTTRKELTQAMAAKGIREKRGLYNRTEV